MGFEPQSLSTNQTKNKFGAQWVRLAGVQARGRSLILNAHIRLGMAPQSALQTQCWERGKAGESRGLLVSRTS